MSVRLLGDLRRDDAHNGKVAPLLRCVYKELRDFLGVGRDGIRGNRLQTQRVAFLRARLLLFLLHCRP